MNNNIKSANAVGPRDRARQSKIEASNASDPTERDIPELAKASEEDRFGTAAAGPGRQLIRPQSGRNNELGHGILLIDKAAGSTSFYLVSLLRRLTKIEKIGHAGTLDPFATGVMVMLIGRDYTRRSDEFLSCDKEYRATLQLGIATDTYDIEGQITSRSDKIPTLKEIELALSAFQGEIQQIPPMYSAKKVEGKKLYDLARKGITIERQPVKVKTQIKFISYRYPMLEIEVACSKGTYIRSLAHDIGHFLGTNAHLFELTRTRSGRFRLEECIPQLHLKNPEFDLSPHMRQI